MKGTVKDGDVQPGIDPEKKMELWFSAYLNQTEILEKQVRWLPIIEGALLVAWYYLFSESEGCLAQGALLLASVLVYLVLFLIRRHVQIVLYYLRRLNSCCPEMFPELRSPAKLLAPLKCTALSGHEINRLFPLVLLAVNSALALYTMKSFPSDPSGYLLFANVLLTGIAWIRLKDLVMTGRAEGFCDLPCEAGDAAESDLQRQREKACYGSRATVRHGRTS